VSHVEQEERVDSPDGHSFRNNKGMRIPGWFIHTLFQGRSCILNIYLFLSHIISV
jgi:hypothetical protein